MGRIQTRLAVVLLLTSLAVSAQTPSFTKDDIEYTVDLPPAWHDISPLDLHDYDFISGDAPANGYLRLRKKLVATDATPADLFRDDEEWDLQSLPGYVLCSPPTAKNFEGNLKGAAFAYEYTSGGVPMAGRIYYLQLDSRTFYVLHFTVTADRLNGLASEMDAIARSFHLK